MKISKAGLDLIKSFESFVPHVYDDLRNPVGGKYPEWRGEKVIGTLTIGYGHTNAAKHPLKTTRGTVVTEAQACEILDVDLDQCEEEVNRLVKVPLSQGQYDALVSFNFNCGAGNLKKLIAPLNAGDYNACRAKFDLYVSSKGKQLRGLVRRRDAEQALWDSRAGDVALPKFDRPVETPKEVEKSAPPTTSEDKLGEKVSIFTIILNAITGASQDWRVILAVGAISLIGVGGFFILKRKGVFS